MAKVKIQGNASGTGVITLIAPNTNTDRTVTLPDESITLGGGVDGIVSTATGTAITIDSSDRVGVGITSSLLAKVHIKEQSSGVTSISANFDQLVLEDDLHSGMHILSGTGSDGAIYFGDSGNSSAGSLKYKHSSDRMVLGTNGAEHFTIESDGRGLSQFTAKAWVNFNGTGTVAIRDSHNVSSITDNGTGDYLVNFTNNMANTNFMTVSESSDWNAHSSAYSSSSAGSTEVRVERSASLYDVDYVAALVFGD